MANMKKEAEDVLDTIEQDPPTKERALKNQALAQKAVQNAISRKREKRLPIALYDAERKQPYIEYAGGYREYYDEQAQG